MSGSVEAVAPTDDPEDIFEASLEGLFDLQLTSAKSVQDRLTVLTHGIDELDAAVTSPNVLHLLHQIS